MTATPSTHAKMPFTSGSRRVPLGELLLCNFVERPASPIKSHSTPPHAVKSGFNSPKQQQHSMAMKSPSRTSSAPMEAPSGRQLFREVLRTNETSDIPLEQSPPIERREGRTRTPVLACRGREGLAASPSPSRSPRPSAQGSCLPTSPSKTSSSSVPRSLGRKKERLRRQLFDEGEGGAADIRAGSPSPGKMKAHREIALRGSEPSAPPPLPPLPSAIGLGIKTGKSREEAGLWSVWQDKEEEEPALDVTALPAIESDEDEGKENVMPASSNTATPLHLALAANSSRKKGTGGRLSLLATADGLEAESTSSEMQGKRRRVTPTGGQPPVTTTL